MKKCTLCILAVMVTFTLFAARDLYIFDNGVTHTKGAEAQAKLLKELGYAGMSTRPGRYTKALQAAFDKEGVKIASSYVNIDSRAKKVPESIRNHILGFKGRGTTILLSLNSKRGTMDSAVRLTREVCDLAADSGLNVVFYCHVGCFTERISTCMEILKRANRKNLGLGFTILHYLVLEKSSGVETMLRKMGKDLKLVQISGADNHQTSQRARILGQGTFDVSRIVRTLDEMDYKGPVYLQCWQIPGPDRKHLEASMDYWKKLTGKKEEK